MRIAGVLFCGLLLSACSLLHATVIYTFGDQPSSPSGPITGGFTFSAPDFAFLDPLTATGNVFLPYTGVTCTLASSTGSCIDVEISLRDAKTVGITVTYAGSCGGIACIGAKGADFPLSDLFSPGIYLSLANGASPNEELSVVNSAPEPKFVGISGLLIFSLLIFRRKIRSDR